MQGGLQGALTAMASQGAGAPAASKMEGGAAAPLEKVNKKKRKGRWGSTGRIDSLLNKAWGSGSSKKKRNKTKQKGKEESKIVLDDRQEYVSPDESVRVFALGPEEDATGKEEDTFVPFEPPMGLLLAGRAARSQIQKRKWNSAGKEFLSGMDSGASAKTFKGANAGRPSVEQAQRCSLKNTSEHNVSNPLAIRNDIQLTSRTRKKPERYGNEAANDRSTGSSKRASGSVPDSGKSGAKRSKRETVPIPKRGRGRPRKNSCIAAVAIAESKSQAACTPSASGKQRQGGRRGTKRKHHPSESISPTQGDPGDPQEVSGWLKWSRKRRSLSTASSQLNQCHDAGTPLKGGRSKCGGTTEQREWNRRTRAVSQDNGREEASQAQTVVEAALQSDSGHIESRSSDDSRQDTLLRDEEDDLQLEGASSIHEPCVLAVSAPMLLSSGKRHREYVRGPQTGVKHKRSRTQRSAAKQWQPMCPSLASGGVPSLNGTPPQLEREPECVQEGIAMVSLPGESLDLCKLGNAGSNVDPASTLNEEELLPVGEGYKPVAEADAGGTSSLDPENGVVVGDTIEEDVENAGNETEDSECDRLQPKNDEPSSLLLADEPATAAVTAKQMEHDVNNNVVLHKQVHQQETSLPMASGEVISDANHPVSHQPTMEVEPMPAQASHVSPTDEPINNLVATFEANGDAGVNDQDNALGSAVELDAKAGSTQAEVKKDPIGEGSELERLPARLVEGVENLQESIDIVMASEGAEVLEVGVEVAVITPLPPPPKIWRDGRYMDVEMICQQNSLLSVGLDNVEQAGAGEPTAGIRAMETADAGDGGLEPSEKEECLMDKQYERELALEVAEERGDKEDLHNDEALNFHAEVALQEDGSNEHGEDKEAWEILASLTEIHGDDGEPKVLDDATVNEALPLEGVPQAPQTGTHESGASGVLVFTSHVEQLQKSFATDTFTPAEERLEPTERVQLNEAEISSTGEVMQVDTSLDVTSCKSVTDDIGAVKNIEQRAYSEPHSITDSGEGKEKPVSFVETSQCDALISQALSEVRVAEHPAEAALEAGPADYAVGAQPVVVIHEQECGVPPSSSVAVAHLQEIGASIECDERQEFAESEVGHVGEKMKLLNEVITHAEQRNIVIEERLSGVHSCSTITVVPFVEVKKSKFISCVQSRKSAESEVGQMGEKMKSLNDVIEQTKQNKGIHLEGGKSAKEKRTNEGVERTLRKDEKQTEARGDTTALLAVEKQVAMASQGAPERSIHETQPENLYRMIDSKCARKGVANVDYEVPANSVVDSEEVALLGRNIDKQEINKGDDRGTNISEKLIAEQHLQCRNWTEAQRKAALQDLDRFRRTKDLHLPKGTRVMWHNKSTEGQRGMKGVVDSVNNFKQYYVWVETLGCSKRAQSRDSLVVLALPPDLPLSAEDFQPSGQWSGMTAAEINAAAAADCQQEAPPTEARKVSGKADAKKGRHRKGQQSTELATISEVAEELGEVVCIARRLRRRSAEAPAKQQEDREAAQGEVGGAIVQFKDKPLTEVETSSMALRQKEEEQVVVFEDDGQAKRLAEMAQMLAAGFADRDEEPRAKMVLWIMLKEDVTVRQLKSTGVHDAVCAFKSHRNPHLVTRANDLLEHWKQLGLLIGE